MKYLPTRKGFGLIEIVVAVGIISLSLFGLAASARIALRVVEENTLEERAMFLLEEGVEAVRLVRDISWSPGITSLSSGTQYFFYPTFNGPQGTWGISAASSGPIDGIFIRTVAFDDVYRLLSTDDIVPEGTGGALLDPDTKRVTVTVSWSTPTAVITRVISTYLTNLFET